MVTTILLGGPQRIDGRYFNIEDVDFDGNLQSITDVLFEQSSVDVDEEAWSLAIGQLNFWRDRASQMTQTIPQ